MAKDERDEKPELVQRPVESCLVPVHQATDEPGSTQTPSAETLGVATKPSSFPEVADDEIDDGGWLCI